MMMVRSRSCVDNVYLFLVLVFISVSIAYELEDDSFGMSENPSRWSGPEQDGVYNPVDVGSEEEFDVVRRGFNPFRSPQRGITPYYFYRDGVNYGGRLGSVLPWRSRAYGVNRLRPSFGIMPIRSRSAPFGQYNRNA